MSKILTALLIVYISIHAGLMLNHGNLGRMLTDLLLLAGFAVIEVCDAIRDRR